MDKMFGKLLGRNQTDQGITHIELSKSVNDFENAYKDFPHNTYIGGLLWHEILEYKALKEDIKMLYVENMDFMSTSNYVLTDEFYETRKLEEKFLINGAKLAEHFKKFIVILISLKDFVQSNDTSNKALTYAQLQSDAEKVSLKTQITISKWRRHVADELERIGLKPNKLEARREIFSRGLGNKLVNDCLENLFKFQIPSDKEKDNAFFSQLREDGVGLSLNEINYNYAMLKDYTESRCDYLFFYRRIMNVFEHSCVNAAPYLRDSLPYFEQEPKMEAIDFYITPLALNEEEKGRFTLLKLNERATGVVHYNMDINGKNVVLRGSTSPVAVLTFSEESKKRMQIPEEADHWCYLYPILESINDVQRTPMESALLQGAFVYLKGLDVIKIAAFAFTTKDSADNCKISFHGCKVSKSMFTFPLTAFKSVSWNNVWPVEINDTQNKRTSGVVDEPTKVENISKVAFLAPCQIGGFNHGGFGLIAAEDEFYLFNIKPGALSSLDLSQFSFKFGWKSSGANYMRHFMATINNCEDNKARLVV